MRSKIPLATALALALAAAFGLAGALQSVDRPFPGFLVLGNGVVASAGLSDWPATRDGTIYQHRIVAMDDVAVSSGAQVQARVRALPEGTAIHYRLEGANGSLERTIPTRRFGGRDFALLYGSYFLNGLLLAGAAVAVLRRRRLPAAGAVAPLLGLGALWGLTAMDLYGPYRLFRLHALAESLLFAAAVHMAIGFPRPVRLVRVNPSVVRIPYAIALVVACLYQFGLYDPRMYTTLHLLSVGALGVGLLCLITSQIGRMFRSAAPEVRRPITVVALGTLLALAPAMFLSIAEPFTGGTSPQNAIAFSAFLFPISIAWAVIREGHPVRSEPVQGTR